MVLWESILTRRRNLTAFGARTSPKSQNMKPRAAEVVMRVDIVLELRIEIIKWSRMSSLALVCEICIN